MPRADAHPARIGASPRSGVGVAPQGGTRQQLDAERRKRVRRTAIVLGCIAAAFYLGFIVMAVVKAELGGGHHAPAQPPAAVLR